ncbi:hypothetical protein CKO11_04545 [Rhodobacter sp. TJ_12]|uniref:hypothetical protein n=1 Tax=Rhodobacter sp. TJ_12 TaxID=2029399 RepID=UPI001CBD5D7E|nr:hypothetical protein [Rhodobacter sp. TJ_12]MBZ4021728.1 hypothetical protein [Rhodobacter sp. TJ_12]
MYGKYLLGGAGLAAVIGWGVWWASHPHASGPGAQALQDQIRAALGPAGPAAVVTPVFDHYVLTLDPARVLPEATGDEPAPFTMSPYELDLRPRASGLWEVAGAPQDLQVQIVMPTADAEGVTVTDYTLQGVVLTGTYDPTIAFMRDWQTSMDRLQMRQTQPIPTPGETPQEMTLEVVFNGYRAATEVQEGATGLNLTGQSHVAQITETVAIPSLPGGAPTELTLSLEEGSGQTEIAGLRWRDTLPVLAKMQTVWAEGKNLQDEQQALAQLMLPTLPLLDQAAARFDFEKLNVKTTDFAGQAALGSLEIDIAPEARKLREALALDGITVAEGVVPAWASALVPQQARVDLGLEGVDLLAMMKLALEDMAAGGTGTVPDAQMAAAMLPGGAMTLRLNPSQMVGAGYTLKAETMAQIDMESSAPKALEATIDLAGTDAILNALQQGPSDVQQAAMGLMAMRGLAQAQDDGTLRWQIALDDEGVPMVNGMSMGALGGMMP